MDGLFKKSNVITEDYKLYLRSQNYLHPNSGPYVTAGSDSGDASPSTAYHILEKSPSVAWSPTVTAINPWVHLEPKGAPLKANRIRISPTTLALEAKIPILIIHNPGGIRSFDMSFAEHTYLMNSLQSAGWQPIFYSELLDWILKGIWPTSVGTKKPFVIHYAGGPSGVYTSYLTDIKPKNWKVNITYEVTGGNYLTLAQIQQMIADGLLEPHVYLDNNTVAHAPSGDVKGNYDEFAYPLWTTSRELPDLWQTRLRNAYRKNIGFIRSVLGYQGDLVMEIPAVYNTQHMFQATQRLGVKMAVNGSLNPPGEGVYPGLDPFAGDSTTGGDFLGDTGSGVYVAVVSAGNGTLTMDQVISYLTTAYVAPLSLIETIDVYVCISSDIYNSPTWRSSYAWQKCTTLTLNGTAVYDQISAPTGDLEFPIYGIRLDITSFSGASVPSIGNVQLFYETNDPSDFVLATERNLTSILRNVNKHKNFGIQTTTPVSLTASHVNIATVTPSMPRNCLLSIVGYINVSINQACDLQLYALQANSSIDYLGVMHFTGAATNVYIPIVAKEVLSNTNNDSFSLGVALTTGTGTINKSSFEVEIKNTLGTS